jgi:MFS transporter, ACS family, glucarate transporter
VNGLSLPTTLPDVAGRPSRARHVVVGFVLGLTAIAYLDRVCIATAAPSMKIDLGLGDAQMGFVFSAFTFAYALFEVPSGWLIDRFGPRLMLTRIVVWWSLMTAATGLASGFASLLVLRFLFGMGEAGAFPGTARAFSRWLPAREHGRAFGLAVMSGALGGALTQPLVVAMLRGMSWRQAFPIFGLVGIVWAAGWFLWFRDDPRRHGGVNQAERLLIGDPPQHLRSDAPWGAMLRSRTLVALCLMYFCMIYGWYFYLTWLPTYLLNARGFDLRQAGWLASLPLASIACGVFCGGFLSDRLLHRRGLRAARRLPGLFGLPAAALSVVVAVTTSDPLTSALLLGLAAGLASLGTAPAWAVCLEIGGLSSGVVSAAMNTFGNLGGSLLPVVVGLCLQKGVSWRAPLLSIAVLYLVAAGCWIAIDPGDRIEARRRA